MTRRLGSIAVLFLKKCKFIKIIIIITVIAAAVSGFFWWRWATSAITPELKTERVFVIRKGESLGSIASRLKEEELIRSSLAFKIIVLTKGIVGQIQAGSFRLGPFLTPFEIAITLTHGTTDVWLTFPEGWRKEEFGRRLASNLENFTYQEFLELTENLEGYLFPDTYLFPKLASPSAAVKILSGNFEKKAGSTSKQALILASIVEREVKYDHDRLIVAGILIKRWQANWLLQADATVQYAIANSKLKTQNSKLENWWEKLKKEDLEIDSPYNTYKYKGLPPTPICNPGLASIRAVIYPQETEYWFYLSDSEGKMHFAKTLEEHNQNIVKYLR